MAERVPIVPDGLAASPAFSPGVRVGEFLFVSGQIAQGSDGNLVGGADCAAQTRQVMARIRTIVEAAGATMQDVVKITTFLVNLDDYPAFSAARSETFPSQSAGQFHRGGGGPGAPRVPGGSGGRGAYSRIAAISG